MTSTVREETRGEGASWVVVVVRVLEVMYPRLSSGSRYLMTTAGVVVVVRVAMMVDCWVLLLLLSVEERVEVDVVWYVTRGRRWM